MFDAIAGRYDLMNRVMTCGQDRRWRKFAVDQGGRPGDGWILDLACGTGDIAALFRKTWPRARVIGADFSRNMLAHAARRLGHEGICWQACDANRLPYHDESFEVVSFGYLLRNVDDSLRVLREVNRVLAAGGRVVCLDTTPPEKNMLYPFIHFYLHFIIPLLGRLIASDEEAYAYLSGSTMDFHGAGELADLFRQAGFAEVGFRKFMFGTISVHWGTK
jgi:demethylmenaquinone methyltransferase/2-methoxy-6-polyprenyl-1,4-benzoquinol methylase